MSATRAADRSFQAEFRPVVDSAWLVYCSMMGESSNDHAARDVWYRKVLRDAAGISTTKSATESQRQACLRAFRSLTSSEMQRPIRSSFRVAAWSMAQRSTFTRLARAAFAFQSTSRSGPDDMIEWLINRLSVALGLSPDSIFVDGTFYLGSHVDGFDLAMGALAVIANDRYWIDRTSEAVERRLRYQLRRFLSDLEWLEGHQVGWRYVLGIYRQGIRLPVDERDATAQQLWCVLQILDTHIRKLCRDRGIRPMNLPSR